MSNIIDLVDEQDQDGFRLDDGAPDTGTSPGTWSPGQGASPFSGLPATPAPAAAPTKKTGRGKKRAEGDSSDGPAYVPLPVASSRPLSKSAQAKADKAELLKEREADAAKVRINGSDEPVEIPKKPWFTLLTGKRARPDEIAETLTDLASMLENGESEHKSVTALAKQYGSYDIGQAYDRVVRLLDRGVTLADAMADQTDNFPPVVRELLGAAKMPRDMHRNLRQAATIIIEVDTIKGQIKSSLFKPGFLLFVLIAFSFAAIQFLLPVMAGMFTGIGAEVPPMTTVLMTIGASLKWVLAGIAVLAIAALLFWIVIGKNNERLATLADKHSLRLPMLGDVIKMSVAARFCDVLSECLNVGMTELESLETASRACGNRALTNWVDEHIGRQRVGIVTFSDVAKTEMLPWNFRNRIETTTSLTRRIEILQELATTFHSKAQVRLNRFAERIGPISESFVVIAIVAVVLLVVSPVLTFIPTMIETIQ